MVRLKLILKNLHKNVAVEIKRILIKNSPIWYTIKLKEKNDTQVIPAWTVSTYTAPLIKNWDQWLTRVQKIISHKSQILMRKWKFVISETMYNSKLLDGWRSKDLVKIGKKITRNLNNITKLKSQKNEHW